MTIAAIVITMFCAVDEQMLDIGKHPQAKLWPSELVTIGLLAALKGGHFRTFYRGLKRDYDGRFGGLPDRSRLQRSLTVPPDWCQRLLAEPSFFTVIDSDPIELIFPVGEGRSTPPAAGQSVSGYVGFSMTIGKSSTGRRHHSTPPTKTFIR